MKKSEPRRASSKREIRGWEMGASKVLDVGSGTDVLAIKLANSLPGIEVVAGDLRHTLQSIIHASRGR
jgi:methylase of polypeptide subunit release factors